MEDSQRESSYLPLCEGREREREREGGRTKEAWRKKEMGEGGGRRGREECMNRGREGGV